MLTLKELAEKANALLVEHPEYAELPVCTDDDVEILDVDFDPGTPDGSEVEIDAAIVLSTP
jgi:hypothetical protein